MEEERRLCYVGFTRARKVLYLTHAKMRSRFGEKPQPSPPSRFLEEVPQGCAETVNAFGKPKGFMPSRALQGIGNSTGGQVKPGLPKPQKVNLPFGKVFPMPGKKTKDPKGGS